MKGNFQKDSLMEKVLNQWNMSIRSKDFSRMGCSMEMGSRDLISEMSIKENGFEVRKREIFLLKSITSQTRPLPLTNF